MLTAPPRVHEPTHRELHHHVKKKRDRQHNVVLPRQQRAAVVFQRRQFIVVHDAVRGTLHEQHGLALAVFCK
jgi:hypothetical protein